MLVLSPRSAANTAANSSASTQTYEERVTALRAQASKSRMSMLLLEVDDWLLADDNLALDPAVDAALKANTTANASAAPSNRAATSPQHSARSHNGGTLPQREKSAKRDKKDKKEKDDKYVHTHDKDKSVQKDKHAKKEKDKKPRRSAKGVSFNGPEKTEQQSAAASASSSSTAMMSSQSDSISVGVGAVSADDLLGEIDSWGLSSPRPPADVMSPGRAAATAAAAHPHIKQLQNDDSPSFVRSPTSSTITSLFGGAQASSTTPRGASPRAIGMSPRTDAQVEPAAAPTHHVHDVAAHLLEAGSAQPGARKQPLVIEELAGHVLPGEGKAREKPVFKFLDDDALERLSSTMERPAASRGQSRSRASINTESELRVQPSEQRRRSQHRFSKVSGAAGRRPPGWATPQPGGAAPRFETGSALAEALAGRLQEVADEPAPGSHIGSAIDRRSSSTTPSALYGTPAISQVSSGVGLNVPFGAPAFVVTSADSAPEFVVIAHAHTYAHAGPPKPVPAAAPAPTAPAVSPRPTPAAAVASAPSPVASPRAAPARGAPAEAMPSASLDDVLSVSPVLFLF